MSPNVAGRRYPVAPSIESLAAVAITAAETAPDATVTGIAVASEGPIPGDLDLDRDALKAAGFEGKVGQTLSIPGTPMTVLVGTGKSLDPARLRDAAAAFARAAQRHSNLATDLAAASGLDPRTAARVVVEGVLLARYDYDTFKEKPANPALSSLTLLGAGADAAEGIHRGRVEAGAACLARDLANAPPILLTATAMADFAAQVGPDMGLEVEVFDEGALFEMGCGGLLGVNAGSTEPPRMIKLRFRPETGAKSKLALVGKGIMYDAGGIALKPADEVHATMKNDMSGAGAILAAMLSLRSLGCENEVTGWLMCTDNRPSGTALAMGDIIQIRGGKTVEVVNTDAEGRLVMADALVLAAEERPDAIVDIATLTGASMRALGTQIAGLMGNNQDLVDQVKSAGESSDEQVWQLPLARQYRRQINSPVADLKNLGGANAGAITAALFLDEFVDGHPWAHIDIAGTAQNDEDTSWRPPGCTGFGARLLIDLAMNFRKPEGENV